MFAFTIKAIKEELLRFAPDIGKMANLGFEEMKGSFENMPSISVDHAVMERSRNLTVVPMELVWNDIGSWDSMFDMSFPGDNKKEATDDVISVDSQNTIVIGDDRIIVTLGLEDCIVVDTDDALLIAKKGSGQKVKNVIEHLVSVNRKEVLEHSTVQRPWGSFTILHEEKGFKVKKVSINPGGKLSLQIHRHRSEHWTVVKGKAKITVDGSVDLYKENDSVYIPVSARHRAENCESTLLEIIEVQCGEYLGEDDIARIEDAYGRADGRSTGNTVPDTE
jgi:mannose-1-phosphate guanylyltransferase/mannose-6-phosphate isomerase